jgi:hypothetical protein
MAINLVDEFKSSMAGLRFPELSNDCANLAQGVFV